MMSYNYCVIVLKNTVWTIFNNALSFYFLSSLLSLVSCCFLLGMEGCEGVLYSHEQLSGERSCVPPGVILLSGLFL